jgi:serine/threonine protein kinase
LCDFGSAKLLVSNQKNVNYICSRYYRSPELILGATDYSTSIDVWSLGCCIGEMMINRPLFDGPNANTLLIKIIKTIGEPSLGDMEAMKV